MEKIDPGVIENRRRNERRARLIEDEKGDEEKREGKESGLPIYLGATMQSIISYHQGHELKEGERELSREKRSRGEYPFLIRI